MYIHAHYMYMYILYEKIKYVHVCCKTNIYDTMTIPWYCWKILAVPILFLSLYPLSSTPPLHISISPGSSLVLGQTLVVSLLANAFLCTFPSEGEEGGQETGSGGEAGQGAAGSGEGEGGGKKLRPFSFRGLFKLLLDTSANST